MLLWYELWKTLVRSLGEGKGCEASWGGAKWCRIVSDPPWGDEGRKFVSILKDYDVMVVNLFNSFISFSWFSLFFSLYF